jgi:hypothetical protein
VNASVVAPEMMRLRMNDRENKAIWTSNSIHRCVRIAPLAASHVSQFSCWKIWSEDLSEGRSNTDRPPPTSEHGVRPYLNLKTSKVGHDAREWRPQINSSAASFINA